MILGEMLTPIINHVQVVIGGEGRWEELKHLSIVLSRYGVPGQFSGAVGVLGPTHLDYGRAVGAVRYVSGLMTTALSGLYEGTVPPEDETEPEDDDKD
jgi:heat-inducible transcriptional repressor